MGKSLKEILRFFYNIPVKESAAEEGECPRIQETARDYLRREPEKRSYGFWDCLADAMVRWGWYV